MGACCVILAHVTWALSIRAAKTVTWVLTQEWALARETTVICYDYALLLLCAHAQGVKQSVLSVVVTKSPDLEF